MSSRRPLARFLSVLAAALFLSACDFAIAEREVWIHHAPAEDVLDVLFVQRGVSAAGTVDRAAEAESILAGRRELGLPFPLNLDLDRLQPEDLTEDERRVVASVEVVDAHAFLDAQGRLSWVQHFRVRESALLFATLSAAVNRELREQDDELEAYPELRETCALWRKAAESGWTWLALEEGQPVLTLPLAECDAPRILQEVLGDAGEEVVAWAGVLSSLRVADGRAVLHLGRREGRLTRLTLPGDGPYEERLARALRERGVAIAPALDLEELGRTFPRAR